MLGQTAYVADGFSGLQIVDVSDPLNPAISGSVDTPVWAYGVWVRGETAYVADGSGGVIIVPVPREVTPVQVIGPSELWLTLPGPSLAGHYNLRVFNQVEGDELKGAVTFLSPEDYQEHFRKKAIIAALGSENAYDRTTLFAVRNCARKAFQTLEKQGYYRENILVLAPYAD